MKAAVVDLAILRAVEEEIGELQTYCILNVEISILNFQF